MAFAAKNGEGTPQEGPLLECMQEITPRLVFPTPAFVCWEHHSEGSRGRQCVHEQNCRRPAKSVFYALRIYGRGTYGLGVGVPPAAERRPMVTPISAWRRLGRRR